MLKNITKWVVNILSGIMLILIVLVVYSKCVTTFTKASYPSYFGYSIFRSYYYRWWNISKYFCMYKKDKRSIIKSKYKEAYSNKEKERNIKWNSKYIGFFKRKRNSIKRTICSCNRKKNKCNFGNWGRSKRNVAEEHLKI